MVVFSQNLNRSLDRAIAQAEQQFYPYATPEHVLLAFIDDPDAIPLMHACNVDLEQLRRDVLALMPHSYFDETDEDPDLNAPDDAPNEDQREELPEEDDGIPVERFQVILERAIDHAQSSASEEVGSADVLVAMLERPVGKLMRQHGLTRYDVTTFISHGLGKDAQISSNREDVANQTLPGDATGSSMCTIELLNDDYTSMDFVLQVLTEIFELESEEAERVMRETHHRGAGGCGTFARKEAVARVARVLDLARAHQHPLRCRLKDADPAAR
jgi:ATP-dependent Clp protease adapter protein ClpS